MNTGRYGEKRSGRKGIKKETDIGREVTRSAKNGKKERKSTWRERETDNQMVYAEDRERLCSGVAYVKEMS